MADTPKVHAMAVEFPVDVVNMVIDLLVDECNTYEEAFGVLCAALISLADSGGMVGKGGEPATRDEIIEEVSLAISSMSEAGFGGNSVN